MSTIKAGTRPRAARSLAVLVIAQCALIGFLDGYDTQALSPVAVELARKLNFPIHQLGSIFSASQIGFLIGALTLGVLGDRLGRKRILMLAVAWFAACSLGTALAPSYEALFAVRLIAGIGLGGATPNFIGLASEYAPPAHRERIITMMWAAVPLGGVASAVTGSLFLRSGEWQMIFYIGALAPMVLLLLMARTLPESREATNTARERQDVRSILFGEGRAMTTVWLWLASFTCWMALIVTVFWTPTLLAKAGHEPASAALMLALHNGGAIVGTLVLGAAIGRLTAAQVLVASLVASGCAITAMGLSIGWLPGLSAATLAAGFFGSAPGAALIALSGGIYADKARSTGVGFALAAGRIGTILGPMVAGMLVERAVGPAHVYFITAIPAFLAIVFVALLTRARSRNV